MGFFPDDELGPVILRNAGGNLFGGRLTPASKFFYTYIVNLLVSGSFDLNVGANDAVVSVYQDTSQILRDKAAQAGPAESAAIAPYLGYYDHGYGLAFDAIGTLRIHRGAGATRLLAMPDGAYVAASGSLVGAAIHLSHNAFGNPQMAIEGAETVRWQSGPP